MTGLSLQSTMWSVGGYILVALDETGFGALALGMALLLLLIGGGMASWVDWESDWHDRERDRELEIREDSRDDWAEAEAWDRIRRSSDTAKEDE